MKILLVGCGAMGSALRQAWMNENGNQVTVVDPSFPASATFRSRSEIPEDFQPELIVFAIKPQIAAEVVPEYASFLKFNPLIISVMAGVSIASLGRYLGNEGAEIVRAMPNLPVVVRQGITALFAKDSLGNASRQRVNFLFSAVGKKLWVASEGQLNLVTAVSGSGPAYFFRFVECLAKAAKEMGLPADQAYELAEQTFTGAGVLLDNSSKSVSKLRESVTSQGGTTAAALAVFDKDEILERIMKEAVQAAFLRATELSQ